MDQPALQFWVSVPILAYSISRYSQLPTTRLILLLLLDAMYIYYQPRRYFIIPSSTCSSVAPSRYKRALTYLNGALRHDQEVGTVVQVAVPPVGCLRKPGHDRCLSGCCCCFCCDPGELWDGLGSLVSTGRSRTYQSQRQYISRYGRICILNVYQAELAVPLETSPVVLPYFSQGCWCMWYITTMWYTTLSVGQIYSITFFLVVCT